MKETSPARRALLQIGVMPRSPLFTRNRNKLIVRVRAFRTYYSGMADTNPHRSRASRESRLLLLTVAVCAVVLLLMARLRFPEAPPAVDASAPAPLERLAARASYDALAADIQRVEPIIAPNLIVLRVAPPLTSAPHDIRDALAPPDSPSVVRHVAAMRISADTAVAAIDSGTRIDGIVGASATGTAAVLAVDPIRRIARIRVPHATVPQLSQVPLASLPTPLYIVVVEGTQAGVTLRPVFLGRGDRYGSSRWSRPLLPLGGIAVSPGALLFLLSGEFIGTVVMENGAPAIVGARDVLETGERLAATASAPSDIGIAVQPLTPALATALGAPRGVVVSETRSGSPAEGQLEPGDVITAVDDWSTDNPDDLLLRLASHSAGDTVTITAVRNGETRTMKVVFEAAKLAEPEASLALAAERGVGTRVEAGAEVSAPGLKPGDTITRAGRTIAPTPVQLRKLLTQPMATGFAVLIIRRDGRQRVVAVPVTGLGDATGR